VKTFIRHLLDCFFLLRIPLLVPVWTILLLGWICGSPAIRIGGFFNGISALPLDVWLVIAGFSLIVASIYVQNQIVDIENDRINHKLFLLPHQFVSVGMAWLLALLCATGGLTIAIFTIKNPLILILFILSLLLGILYNFPPLQLKNRPFGGVFANALGHGLITFLVGWEVAKMHSPSASGMLVAGIISGLAPAFANGAVYLATTIPDAKGDRMTGKRTFCVAFGEKKTAIASALLCLAAFIASFFIENHFWVMAIPSGISIVLFLAFAIKTTSESAFKSFKWPVIILTAFVACIEPEYGILTLLTFFGSKAYYKGRFGMNYPTLDTNPRQ
jgi:4-hydroxybenzoate polyprenyltransferase